ncbi:MAG TPA: hypothetical protein VLA72_12905 [Anaerolineales bacterium]|jgi:hypothetical protein|nr:hypothetical protein [Anaerolineales bacterium]
MKQRILLLASLLSLIAGCASPASNPIPTPYPPEYLPTVVALTAESIANAANDSATMTVAASLPTEEPTQTPEPTLTFTPAATRTPTSIPGHRPGAIRFEVPGPMSKVVSPITLRMLIKVGESEKMQVDLFGEDGRLLSRTVKNVPTSNNGALQSVKIPFEIRATAEVGRITVMTLDKAGRIQALNSVRVLLLSSGENEITPTGDPSEPFGVFSPVEEEEIEGGVVNIRGDVWPFSIQPIILELIDPDGKSLGLRIVTIENVAPQLLETTIPYKVSEPTLARLTIRQDDDRMEGLFYVYSQLVLLKP